jgi:hypothetical protein
VVEYRSAKPVRETEWTRVYKSDEGYVHVSKFLEGGLDVSAQSVRQRWSALSPDDRLDLAQALSSLGKFTAEQEGILDFLMEAGDLPVWMEIAVSLPHHSNRDQALAFLVDVINHQHEHRANFFQALGMMKDARALPSLRAAYDGYRKGLGAGPAPEAWTEFDYVGYLACCEALWKISGSGEYKEAIRDALESKDKHVRSLAALIVRNL